MLVSYEDLGAVARGGLGQSAAERCSMSSSRASRKWTPAKDAANGGSTVASVQKSTMESKLERVSKSKARRVNKDAYEAASATPIFAF